MTVAEEVSMEYEFLRVTQDGAVGGLTLARPQKRNALSVALMREVIAALEAIPDETQAVVIAGDGPAFSAGHDLAEMLDRDDRFYDELFEACTVMMETIHAFRRR
jgi:enoyl-CoA hydratase/carnithine racemase